MGLGFRVTIMGLGFRVPPQKNRESIVRLRTLFALSSFPMFRVISGFL